MGRIDELLQLRRHLCLRFARLRTRSEIIQFVWVDFQIVKILHKRRSETNHAFGKWITGEQRRRLGDRLLLQLDKDHVHCRVADVFRGVRQRIAIKNFARF